MHTVLVKAFSDNPNAGNPAGVILSDQALPEEQMKSIAHELGFSESAFVYKEHDRSMQYLVRYFTRGKVEVPLCGHATIALARVLDDQNPFESITISTLSGLIKVTKIGNEYYFSTIEKIIGKAQFNSDEIAILLGLTNGDILNLPIVSASAGGKPKVMIPIKSLKTMQLIQPAFERMINFCKQNDVYGFYPFSQETVHIESDFHARQFNPLAGINEDPQTGVAAGALVVYAQHFKITNQNVLSIEQGFEMGLPGIIKVLVKEDSIMVGGSATPFGSKDVDGRF
ncbi:PhzF family phenazine biosynthesis protein [Candidatus Gracilibacteria bacterium]|nr:PhzF family phenazine biosynthesis protein [Candidatus Gracilibacteria bacterium]